MITNYLLNISETGAVNPGSQHNTFNTINKTFKSIELLKSFLKERYGKEITSKRRQKVYQDNKEGVSAVTGFCYSYWNADISHNSKNWHQTDWISVYEETLVPILI